MKTPTKLKKVDDVEDDPEADEEKRPNWQLPSSRWVVIDPVSGIVHTAVNAVAGDWYEERESTDDYAESYGIREARTIAAERTERGGH